MQIGTIIKKYRKNKNLTQEEMAKRLGVTAPAVNKWENGHSFPDISLLSPIARLLDISTDMLLTHKKELSDAEADRFIEEVHERLKKEAFCDVLEWTKQCIAEHPNCCRLILWMARILDAHRQMMAIPADEKYDKFILSCYQRALESDDEIIKSASAESLYYFYVNKEQYEQAETCLSFFSRENPERKRKQAMIYRYTGKHEDAYKMFEELLYSGYQNLNMTFQDIYILALKENDLKKASLMVEKQQSLAHLFEFGEYHEISSGLELATLEKNEEQTLHIMERMLANLESIGDFTKSALYSHMCFNPINGAWLAQVREDLIKGFQDAETYAYLKENRQWKKLVGLPLE